MVVRPARIERGGDEGTRAGHQEHLLNPTKHLQSFLPLFGQPRWIECPRGQRVYE